MIAPVSVVARRVVKWGGRPERDAGHGWHSSSVAFHVPGAAYRRVLGNQTRVLGADHPDTLTIRGNLTYLLVEADLCPGQDFLPLPPAVSPPPDQRSPSFVLEIPRGC